VAPFLKTAPTERPITTIAIPDCQKHRFRIPDGIHYLNCAYMSPLPIEVEEAVMTGLQRKRVPAGIHPEDFFSESDEVRERFARLIGASDGSRVAIHPSVSYGVATAARNLPVEEGQTVALLGEQFPGNVYAWRRRASEAGATVRTVARPESATPGEAWNAALLDAIDQTVAVVAMPTVHWTDGTRFDLVAVGARCREVGAALVLDGTQSVGAAPFRLDEVRPDALVVAGYKWLMGAYSLTLSWLGPRFDGGTPLEETWIARDRSEDFQALVDYRDEYQPGAVRYDVGERSNFALIPGLRAALGLLLEWTPEGISGYVAALAGPLLDEARALGFTVENPAWRSSHLFGLRMPAGVDLAGLAGALQERRVYASLRGTSLRLSPHLYNIADDIEALLGVLREARAGVG
jgi:selenocysteine lyase/cysteine desulfurase